MQKVWTTQSGEKIKVKDMTTFHIKNCIKALEEGRIAKVIDLGWLEDNDCKIIDEDINWKNNWLEIFNEELIKRKE